MDNPVRWAAAIVLAALFCILAAYNGYNSWERLVRRAPAPSLAPLAGGVFGLMAVLAAPFGSIAERLSLAWIPLLLDVSVPLTLYALFRDLTARK